MECYHANQLLDVMRRITRERCFNYKLLAGKTKNKNKNKNKKIASDVSRNVISTLERRLIIIN
jgi:hypothetical protein